MKLADIQCGDRIKGFEGFGCIPGQAVRIVRRCDSGLYVKCREGIHLLDGQEDEDGTLIGITRA